MKSSLGILYVWVLNSEVKLGKMFLGLAILPVAVWTVITAVYNDVNCWAVDTTNYGYIYDGPRIFALVVSLYLIFHNTT